MAIELMGDYVRVAQRWAVGVPGNTAALEAFTRQLIEHNRNPGSVPCPAAPAAAIVAAQDAERTGRAPDGQSDAASVDLLGPHRIAAFRQLVLNHAGDLGTDEAPAFQVAYNSSADGPVARAMEERWAASAQPTQTWLRNLVRGSTEDAPECIFRKFLGPMSVVTMTPDGRHAVSGHSGGQIHLWNLDTGVRVRAFMGHKNEVASLSVSADERFLVSLSMDRTLKRWSLRTGECIREFTCRGCRFMDTKTWDGTLVVGGIHDHDSRGRRVRRVSICDFRAWGRFQHLCTLQGAGLTPRVALAADGQRLLIYDQRTCALERWSLPEKRCISRIQVETEGTVELDMTPDGKWAVLGDEHRMRVFDLALGDCTSEFGGAAHRRVVAITADGRWVLSGGSDTSVRAWEVGSGRCLRECEGHPMAVRAVAVCADGSRAVSGDASGELRAWDLRAKPGKRVPHHHAGEASNILIADRHRIVISTGRQYGTVRHWDLETGEPRGTSMGTEGIAFAELSPDESVYVCVGFGGPIAHDRGRWVSSAVGPLLAGMPARHEEGNATRLPPSRVSGQPLGSHGWSEQPQDSPVGFELRSLHRLPYDGRTPGWRTGSPTGSRLLRSPRRLGRKARVDSRPARSPRATRKPSGSWGTGGSGRREPSAVEFHAAPVHRHLHRDDPLDPRQLWWREMRTRGRAPAACSVRPARAIRQAVAGVRAQASDLGEEAEVGLDLLQPGCETAESRTPTSCTHSPRSRSPDEAKRDGDLPPALPGSSGHRAERGGAPWNSSR